MSNNGKTAVVGLKYPNGLLIQNYTLVDGIEPSPAGSRTVKVAQKIGPAVRLRGYNETMSTPLIVPKHEKSFNIPYEVIELWVRDHRDSDLVQNGLLLFATTEAELDAMIRDRAAGACGLEPLAADPKQGGASVSDPRVPVLNRKMQVGTADVL
jgi:hypothetical protein